MIALWLNLLGSSSLQLLLNQQPLFTYGRSTLWVSTRFYTGNVRIKRTSVVPRACTFWRMYLPFK